MTKQAKNDVTVEQLRNDNVFDFKSQEMDLQMRFSKMTPEQRLAVGNYLNAYNLAAWIYNELIDEDCRVYIDLAMKYTMETQALAKSMHDISDNPNEVQQLVDAINNGEKD